jgi:hypothetical protein
VREIRFLQQLGYDRVILVHDLLTVNRKFISDLCDALLASQMPIEWMANSRLDIGLDGLLPKMKAAGCWKLFFGIESASERIQEECGKHLKPTRACATIGDLARHGITATCSFVVGFPTESPAELASSFALGAKLKLVGAETVQFHRLRLWPPAPMANLISEVEFDRDSLAIEYPFLELDEIDLIGIQSNPTFFGGNFVPKSSAGNRRQIAQIEMFAHHVTAIAPMTVAALHKVRSRSIVDSFYAAIEARGALERRELDWETGRVLQNWRIIKPYLEYIIDRSGLTDVDHRFVDGLLQYEDMRVNFAATDSSYLRDDFLESSCSFLCDIDIPEALVRLASDRPLDSELMRPTMIVFRRERGIYQCFAGPPS